MKLTAWLMLILVGVPLGLAAAPKADLAVSQRIGPTGGVIEIPGYVKAIIPPGALVREVELSIRAIPPPPNIQLHPNVEIIGPAYEFTPDITFAKPVEIRLYCRKEDCPPRSFEGGWAVMIGVVAKDWGVDMESSKTGDPFPESAHQDPDFEARYVGVLATRWRGEWGGLYRVFASSGLSIRERIGPAGGVVDLDYVAAIIPPGALEKEVELRIKKIRPPRHLPPWVTEKIVGPVYAFAPAITFAKPVEIRLYYMGWERGDLRPLQNLNKALVADPAQQGLLGRTLQTAAERLNLVRLTPSGTLLPELGESGAALRGAAPPPRQLQRYPYLGVATRNWAVTRTLALP